MCVKKKQSSPARKFNQLSDPDKIPRSAQGPQPPVETSIHQVDPAPVARRTSFNWRDNRNTESATGRWCVAATLSKARVAAGRGVGVEVGSVDAVEDTADDDDSVSASASPDDRPRNKYAPKGPSGSESSTEYSLSLLLLSSDADR